MFRDSWVIFAALATVLGLATGQEALLFMAALLVTVIPIARGWNRWALRRLHYTRRFDEERAFVGETVGVTLELENRKPLPLLWVRVDDRFPETMVPTGRELIPSGLPRVGLLSHVTALLWFERVRWRYELPCTQRGFYFFGPVALRSGDIFGMFESEAVQEGTARLIVYPQVQPLERFGLPAKDPFGGTRTHLPIFEDPTRVVGTRDYHPDDPMRRVHWKASARVQQLQVRVWEPTQAQQLVVLLNVATFPKHWQGINRELLEWVISVAASICLHAFEARNTVGLVANASVPQSDQPVRVAAGRSPHQMRFILEALAAITPFATSSVDELLGKESRRLAWGATLVIVSAVVTDELLAQLLRLHRAGRRLALVSLDNSFDQTAAERLNAQGIVVHRLPHRLDRRASDAQDAADTAEATWMQPEAHDPHAPFKPNRTA